MIQPHELLHASRDRMERLHREAATHDALAAARATNEPNHAAAWGLRSRIAMLLRALAERLEAHPPVRPT